MSQSSATMRATSLLASAAILAAAAIAALTMQFTLRAQWSPPETPPISFVPWDPPPPTPEPVRTATPRPSDPIDTTSAEPFRPAETINVTARPGEATMTPPIETITRPTWLRRPTDLQRYYPRNALRREIAGDVVLDCIVRVSGDLACVVVSETPREWGFGAAALRIAGDHRMAPAVRGGVPVEGRYRMRVPFRVE